MEGSELASLKDEQWMSVCFAGMNLDTKALFNVLSGNQPKTDGYITPPLQSPRAPNRGSGKRLGIVTLLVLMLLYMCGFTVTGSRGGNQKVVIILAANLGGGSLYQMIFSNGRRIGCKEGWRLGYGKVEY